MIHYPTLTITNEFDKSHTANNVYVKVVYKFIRNGREILLLINPLILERNLIEDTSIVMFPVFQ